MPAKTIIQTRKNGSTRVMLDTGRETRTVQSEAENCDVNKMIAKYQQTGKLPASARTGGTYGDFSGVKDYKSAIEAVMAAQDKFMALDSKLRQRFDNDPGKLLAFLGDKNNKDEAIALGLVEAPQPKPQPLTKEPAAEPAAGV